MAKFRLKMATQLGEKIAAEFGFDAFPVRPHEIAAKKDIGVEVKPFDVKGISGAIIFAGNEVTIVYSTEYESRGFENFSLSHELGHYFLPDHPDEILKTGGRHFSKADFTQNTPIELEADHFASGLLMPGHLARVLLSDAPVGLEGILKLAAAAECSCTAAAIRAAECAAYPIAIIVSSGEEIDYSFLSEPFKDLGKLTFLRKGMRLPDTHTLRFNADPNNVLSARRHTAEATLTEWFEWAKAASGILVFEAGFVGVLGPMQHEAEQSAKALAGQVDPALLSGALTAESGTLWVLLAVSAFNVIFGIWRPRLTRLPK